MPAGPPCPLLAESLVQFCGASPVTKFVPYTTAVLSRCGSGAFRYCDLYLDLTHPNLEQAPGAESIPLPDDLLYSTNHWWLELAPEGPCHIGIDAFLARLFGKLDRLEYVMCRGMARPSIVLTLGDTDYQTAFPEPIPITGYNAYLRRDPARLTAEPYTRGWLFESGLNEEKRARLRASLMDAGRARAWLVEETGRVNEVLQSAQPDFAADGGVFTWGLLRDLPREDGLRLFHEFGSLRREA
jgi:glycine cleavage system H lipoate-binding protein